MFENMVRSAALPLVMEMLHAVHKGLLDTASHMAEKKTGDGFDAAILGAKIDAFEEMADLVGGIIENINASHRQEHGTPAPQPAIKTNFGPHA